MIRVMIVDDELPALNILECILGGFDNVQICGIFTDPDKLMDSLKTIPVDLVFADMNMPGMHGLKLAACIQEHFPHIYIVFVTAYNDYAIEAYKLEALDYVLKPITHGRMQKTLERYKRRGGNSSTKTIGF